MKDIVVRERLGSMSRHDPVTPEVVDNLSQKSLSYADFCHVLERYELNAGKVVHDPTRVLVNTFYADYDKGMYGCLSISSVPFEEANRDMLRRLRRLNQQGNSALQNKDWETYYGTSSELFLDFFAPPETVPLPMIIYDFGRRMRDFPRKEVFGIWSKIYKRIDYSNGMWTSEILDYVFKVAPKTAIPDTGENGLVTVYRGVGELSMPPEKAISWSIHPGNALWFANHSGRGTGVVVADAAPEDIVLWQPGFHYENEVIVWPGRIQNIRNMDMLPANEDIFVQLAAPALPEFCRFGKQAEKFGYEEESILEDHGIKHILRVLLLSLIYFHNSGAALSIADRDILVYFSLLHDVGRVDEETDDGHGVASVKLIHKRDLRVSGLQLRKKDYRIAELVIQYHCLDDNLGIAAINAQTGFTQKDKARAHQLISICKDMDGLDRVRFNGLDPRKLRTDYARRLPLIAGCLLKENLPQAVERGLSNG